MTISAALTLLALTAIVFFLLSAVLFRPRFQGHVNEGDPLPEQEAVPDDVASP